MFSKVIDVVKNVKKEITDTAHDLHNTAQQRYNDYQFDISHSNILSIDNRSIRIIQLLAEGGFSYVYKVIDINTQQIYALKKCLVSDAESKRIVTTELSVYQQLSNQPHICKYYGTIKRKSSNNMNTIEVYILLEYCSAGTLASYIQQHITSITPFSELHIHQLFIQCVAAVYSLHCNSQNIPIVHRDLKIEQLLCQVHNGSIILKLCDFGSCSTEQRIHESRSDILQQEELISKYSTALYRAPEMCDLYRRELIGTPVDIWSLGCILYCMAYFTHPYQDGGNLQIINNTFTIPDTPKYSKYCTGMIKKCLSTDPTKRPTIQQLQSMCDKWYTALTGNKINKSASYNSTTHRSYKHKPSNINTMSSSTTNYHDNDAFADFTTASMHSGVSDITSPLSTNDNSNTINNEFGAWDPFATATKSTTNATPIKHSQSNKSISTPINKRTSSNVSLHTPTQTLFDLPDDIIIQPPPIQLQPTIAQMSIPMPAPPSRPNKNAVNDALKQQNDNIHTDNDFGDFFSNTSTDR